MSDSPEANQSADSSDDRAERTASARRRRHSSRTRGDAPERSPEWPFGLTPQEQRERRQQRTERLSQWGMQSRPDVDIATHPTELTVWIDLPGCEEETIELSGDEWTLYVTAERAEAYWEDGGIHRRERSRQAERSISLPSQCHVDDAEASFENGVLIVRLPKHESAHTKPIGFE